MINFFVYTVACHTISMGQGQEVHARRLLQQCQTQVRSSYFSSVYAAAVFNDMMLLMYQFTLGWVVVASEWSLGIRFLG